MKKLILARHAKSSWESFSADIERTLNERGLHDAPIMASYLKSQNVIPDVIISSPAVRAQTTARFYAEQLLESDNNIITEDSIYEASEQTLLNIIISLSNEANTVMLVGHNPAFTMLANILANERIVDMPTCSSVTINFDVADWAGVDIRTGKMERFDYPKKLE
jgi:phosphohistidine phosphatase